MGKPEGKARLEDFVVGEGQYYSKTVRNKMDWIELAQERDKRRAAVKAAMNLQVPQNKQNLLTK